MVKTVLYAEKLYDNDKVEREVFGPDVRVVWRNVPNLSQLEDSDCADIDGLMVMRHAVTAEHLARFPKLACVVRMGVGYDKIDRKAAAARQVSLGNRARCSAVTAWRITINPSISAQSLSSSCARLATLRHTTRRSGPNTSRSTLSLS